MITRLTTGTAALLLAGLLAIPLLLSGNSSTSLVGCGTTAEMPIILDTIRTLESGGRYDIAKNRGGASGAYQYIDSTWSNYGGYPSAYLAPPEAQDARAALDVQRVLDRYGDIAAIPITWYWPRAHDHPEDLDIIPMPTAGNTLTVRQYQARWLTLYEKNKSAASISTTDPVTPTIRSGAGATLAAELRPTSEVSRSPIGSTMSSPSATLGTGPESGLGAEGGDGPGDGDVTTSTAPGSATPCAGSTDVSADGYALPIPRAIIDANPDILNAPHHDYPAIDLLIPEGTPVYAVRGGTVARVVNWPHNCWELGRCDEPCGIGLSINADDGTRWIYCHGSQLNMALGQSVAAGQLIMLSGNTGRSGAPHLHLELKVDGARKDPRHLLGRIHSGTRSGVTLS